MQPTIGRIVHYTLGDQDARWIEENVPAFQRNAARAGQTYPAVVVAVFHPSTTTANLKVLLDGGAGAEYWATSRTEGDEPGQWSWPLRV